MAHEYLTRIAKSMLMYAYIDLRGRELIVTLLPPNGEVSAPLGASLLFAYVLVLIIPVRRIKVARISTD